MAPGEYAIPGEVSATVAKGARSHGYGEIVEDGADSGVASAPAAPSASEDSGPEDSGLENSDDDAPDEASAAAEALEEDEAAEAETPGEDAEPLAAHRRRRSRRKLNG